MAAANCRPRRRADRLPAAGQHRRRGHGQGVRLGRRQKQCVGPRQGGQPAPAAGHALLLARRSDGQQRPAGHVGRDGLLRDGPAVDRLERRHVDQGGARRELGWCEGLHRRGPRAHRAHGCRPLLRHAGRRQLLLLAAEHRGRLPAAAPPRLAERQSCLSGRCRPAGQGGAEQYRRVCAAHRGDGRHTRTHVY